ncbi:CHAD domain-containing protein [Microbacterium sp. QXD-8]|uniref:CHAD domain-containing protein n=1 Tax=Microbacterium psychrotolerans TaxID=3068321 RepID=A0ABU0Z3I1_9MICO|nr:CHAD domain-containing protein [Microbacterium sp. QXD-8]MDQ7878535.1 CHAD domain-containing protein [Microbacterium sp. QXD-8]
MRRPQGSPTLGEVLGEIVRRAADEVDATLPAAVADEPDGVHQHRVRVRRLRSVLGGFRDALDARAAERVRVAYAEWGRELGVVRDIEVRAEVAGEMIARAGVDDPDVQRRLVGSEQEAYAVAHRRLVELAASPRAEERARLLREFVEAANPVEPHREAAEVLVAAVARQARRVEKAESRLDGTDARYHDLRKAARRMRYVAESVTDAAPGLGTNEIEALVEAGDDIHDALGAHRDTTLLAQRVEHEAVLAGRAGELSHAYDRIAEVAREEAAQRLDEVPQAMRRLKAAASRLP